MQRGGRLSCIQNSTPLQTAKMALVPSYFALGPYYLCVYLCACVFNVYMCVCGLCHMCAGACEGQKRMPDPPELESQVTVSCLM